MLALTFILEVGSSESEPAHEKVSEHVGHDMLELLVDAFNRNFTRSTIRTSKRKVTGTASTLFCKPKCTVVLFSVLHWLIELTLSKRSLFGVGQLCLGKKGPFYS